MNKKMIVYILGKMLGTEGLLLLYTGGGVSPLQRKNGSLFSCSGGGIICSLSWIGKEKAGEQTDLREGRLCDRRTCVDFMVVVRSASVLFCRIVFRIILMRFLKRFPVLRRPDLLFCRI